MKISALILALVVALMLPLSALSESEASQVVQGAINIGVAYPSSVIDGDTYFREGLDLALDTINEAGGALGKQFNLVVRDDGNDITTGLVIGQSFIDQKVDAVIGHWSSNVCYVVKDLYESASMLMITPSATSKTLVDAPSDHVFRTIPSVESYAQAIAEYISAMGLKAIAIYYTPDVYGYAYANQLEAKLSTFGVTVVDRITSISKSSAAHIEDRWNAFGVDGVFVAAVLPEAAEVIHLIRDMDHALPIFGAENFDRRHFAAQLGENMSRIHMATYDPAMLDQAFLQAFRERYSHDPSVFAVAGYQALTLLRDAYEATGTTESGAVAEYLRGLSDYPSAMGPVTYGEAEHEFIGGALRVRAVAE